MAYKGTFKPKNPKKYKGDPTNIIYRSRWESFFMSKLDLNDSVITWASEEIIIPYRSSLDGRIHRYFPDFYVKSKNPNGTISEMIIEIKPLKETQEPKQGKSRNRYLTEVKTYIINKNKWDYARAYCANKGWEFIIVTEKDLGLNF
jgi:hypothetical protein